MLEPGGLPEVVHRWRHPDSWSREPLLVAHRGAFVCDNCVILAENSVAAVGRAAAMGCDMVEIDVRFTRDGTAVVLHDATLDRTTNRTGAVADFSYAELRGTKLVNHETHAAYADTLPVLEEILAALGDQLMVNVECKTGIGAIPAVARAARRAGKLAQTTVKTPCNTAAELNAVHSVLEGAGMEVDYIPVIDDAEHSDLALVEEIYSTLAPNCVECIVRLPKGPGGGHHLQTLPVTVDGGLLFSARSRRLAHDVGARLFVNTLYASPFNPQVQWNGGRNDQLGRASPDSVYGFWIAHGASVIQTDEPEFVLEWLRAAGLRPQAQVPGK